MPLPAERFQLRKSPGAKNPWLVEDTQADPAEDSVLYHFQTKKKAEAFKTMMDDERRI